MGTHFLSIEDYNNLVNENIELKKEVESLREKIKQYNQISNEEKGVAKLKQRGRGKGKE